MADLPQAGVGVRVAMPMLTLADNASVLESSPELARVEMAEGEEYGIVLTNLQMQDGIIEADMRSEILPHAAAGARGFVGLAFHATADAKAYETIYLRPLNGRSTDQVRRNRSVQYAAHPDYPWRRLREEFPAKYEAYVDLEMGQWTSMRIELDGAVARLYVNGSKQPVLIAERTGIATRDAGFIGLFVASGTRAEFRNLRVTPRS